MRTPAITLLIWIGLWLLICRFLPHNSHYPLGPELAPATFPFVALNGSWRGAGNTALKLVFGPALAFWIGYVGALVAYRHLTRERQ